MKKLGKLFLAHSTSFSTSVLVAVFSLWNYQFVKPVYSQVSSP